jgi:hypothetical protein
MRRAALVLALSAAAAVSAQGGLASATAVRCTFDQRATGAWKGGTPSATVDAPKLVLRFVEIDVDSGTAHLVTGTMKSEVTVRTVPGYLHFMQAFRTGPLYTTTVFEAGASGGKFRAVHSRHELFTVPLPGATSTPEQYYGVCEIAR